MPVTTRTARNANSAASAISTAAATSAAARGRPDTVSALERGVAVLRCFTETQRVLSPTELARLTDIPRPTVTRLAQTLVAMGLLRLQPGSEAFALGPGVVSLARVFLAGLDVRGAARPHLQALAEAAAGSVYLAVPDGLDMVLIEACRPQASMLAPRLDVGSRAPMAQSALGRAHLWALGRPPLGAPDGSARKPLLAALKREHGKRWATLEPPLLRALQEADRTGCCVSAGEFHREIHSVSVPLLGAGGEPMALNCGSAAFAYSEAHLRRVVTPLLLRAAQAIARDIGGHVPAPR